MMWCFGIANKYTIMYTLIRKNKNPLITPNPLSEILFDFWKNLSVCLNPDNHNNFLFIFLNFLF